MIEKPQKKEILKEQVHQILLMPIECYKDYNNGNIEIKKENVKENVKIMSSQMYYPQYINENLIPFRYDWNPDKNPDEDMSDFACRFYEIIYKGILPGNTIIDKVGNLSDKQYCGDTMTSVSKIPSLKDRYHCLANFWILPMHIGHTFSGTPKYLKKWSKTSDIYNTEDFMDRWLLLLKYKFVDFKENFSYYFHNFKSFEEFVDTHFLKGSYVDDNYNIVKYSDSSLSEADLPKTLFGFMETRAKVISTSNYADDLWEFFNGYNLFDLQL